MDRKRRRQKNRRPLFLIALGIVLMIGAVVIWAFASQEGDTPGGNVSRQPTPAPDQISRVTLLEAKTGYDQGRAVFLDVRSLEYSNLSHIPGAVLIPEEELSARVNELNPQDWIIPYCT